MRERKHRESQQEANLGLKAGSTAARSALWLQNQGCGCLVGPTPPTPSPELLLTHATLNRLPLGLQNQTLHTDYNGRDNGFGKSFPGDYTLEMIYYKQMLCKLHSATQM